MKTILFPAITLDGFIADLSGECNSWINDEGEADYTAAVKQAGGLLVGRKTFDQYPEDFPPNSGATVFVYTTQSIQSDDDKIKFLRGTPAEILEQIAAYGFQELVIGGGGELNGAIAAAGLLDEIMVSIYGVTLGEGIPLFGSRKPKLSLKLISSTQGVAGIVNNHYLVNK